MKLVCDNSERIDHLRAILTICSWDMVAKPLPEDMKRLLLELDIEALEEDMWDALQLQESKPVTLRAVA